MSSEPESGAPLEDPLQFVLDALESEGALADRRDDRATALLPPAVATRLGLGEELHLCLYPERKTDVAAGLGSPILEKLLVEARGLVPAASARLDMEPPRPAHVRSLAERFVLRNGLAEIVQLTVATGTYLAAHVAYAIEADERREGLLSLVTASDGAEPDAGLQALLAGTTMDPRIVAARTAVQAASAARHVAVRAERAVRAAAAPVLQEVERRHGRDRERIIDYFGQLGAEARSPRRKTDPAAIAAKLAHLTAERDKKIEDLRSRYAVRVQAGVAALVAIEVPCALVEMRLRRRKAERAITLRVPVCVRAADSLACEGCGLPAARPAACDDAVHLLCEVCAPTAQGRLACAACKRRG